MAVIIPLFLDCSTSDYAYLIRPMKNGHQLDYAKRPAWHRRKRVRRWVVVGIIGALFVVGYLNRGRLRSLWDETTLAWVQWRCLHASFSENTVMYEEDAAIGRKLLADSHYMTLSQGAMARTPELWYALKARLGPRTFLWPQEWPGALIFLHERYTPSGERLLVCASYGVSPNMNPMLSITLLRSPSIREPFEFAGGLRTDDMMFYGGGGELRDISPHPQQHTLSIGAAQPDSNDRTRFWFYYKVDGWQGRAVFQILDPDPTSNVPTWARVTQVRNGVADYK